jgi:phage host-nuclease inhibitor protein Gam
MTRPRKLKKPAATVAAPRDRAEAETFLARIGAAERELAVIQAAFDEVVATAKAEAEERALAHRLEVEGLTTGIQLWAEANRAVLTQDGKTKTVDLATGKVGWRNRPPKVQVKDEDAVIAHIEAAELEQFLRRKVTLDRDALKADPVAANAIPGITIGSAGEEFFLEPTGMALAKGSPAPC